MSTADLSGGLGGFEGTVVAVGATLMIAIHGANKRASDSIFLDRSCEK
jgi:hypothetical protein